MSFYKLYSSVLGFFLLSIFTQPAFAFGSEFASDTLIPDRNYAGYRLQVSAITIEKAKPDYVQIKCLLANTGKFDIQCGKGKNLPYLQLIFDQSLLKNDLGHLQTSIRRSILAENMKISTGEFKRDVLLKVATNIPESDPSEESQLTAGQSVGSTTSKSDGGKFPIFAKEKTTEAPVVVFETPTFESRPIEEILKEKNACPDLVFDTIRLIRQDNKVAVLEFTISNIGKGPAQIYGNGKGLEDNLAIRAFVSGGKTLSKGAQVIGGDHIRSGLEHSEGTLVPGQSFSGTI